LTADDRLFLYECQLRKWQVQNEIFFMAENRYEISSANSFYLTKMNLKTKWKIFRIGVTFFFLMLGWLVFTGNLDPQSLLLGVIFSFFIALITYDYFVDETEVFLKDILPRPDIILLYLIILIAKVYIASFDVAYRVLTMRINPGEIRIRTRLRSELARVLLANSITITPGTLTIDLRDDYLYVHWLESKGTSALQAGELIKGTFERLLRRIFR